MIFEKKIHIKDIHLEEKFTEPFVLKVQEPWLPIWNL